MKIRTEIQCGSVVILVNIIAGEITKRPLESGSYALAHKKTQNMDYGMFTERKAFLLPDLSRFYETGKQQHGTCKANLEAAKTLDMKKGPNDSHQPATSTQTDFIRKLLVRFWFIIFLANVVFLIKFIAQIARSRSVEGYLFNLAALHICLSIACFQLMLLTILQKELEFGGMRITTNRFMINVLGIASSCAILPVVAVYYRIFI